MVNWVKSRLDGTMLVFIGGAGNWTVNVMSTVAGPLSIGVGGTALVSRCDKSAGAPVFQVRRTSQGIEAFELSLQSFLNEPVIQYRTRPALLAVAVSLRMS